MTVRDVHERLSIALMRKKKMATKGILGALLCVNVSFIVFDVDPVKPVLSGHLAIP